MIMVLRLVCFSFVLCLNIFASPVIKPAGGLDRDGISKLYLEGDLDVVEKALSGFLKEKEVSVSLEDKIFAYKYLSVVYAARPETKAKAESYMYQLLKLVPTIELVDMYASDAIEAHFLSVKTKFLERRQYSQTHDSFGRPLAPNTAGKKENGQPDKDKEKIRNRSKSWIWWTLGLTAVTGSAVAYSILSEDKPTNPPKSDYTFP